MITLKEAFHLPIGYSDHTVGSEVAVAAVALGAKIVEKHFTLSSSGTLLQKSTGCGGC